MQVGAVLTSNQKVEGSPPTKDFAKLDALTSLRFFAAFMIVLLHFDQIILQGHETFITGQLALQQGVSFFFVLSGFILFYRYPTLPTLASCRKFFVARFARIYPAHIISMLLMVSVLPACMWCTVGKRSIWLLVASATMIQSLIPNIQYYYAINTPAWSISTEFVFYLLFPLLIYRWRETRLIKLLACAALLTLFLVLAEKLRGQPVTGNTRQLFIWLVYVNPFVRLIEFVTGMLTANLYAYARSRFDPSALRMTILQALALVAVGLCVVFCKEHPIAAATAQLPQTFTFWAEGSGGFLVYAFVVFVMSYSRGAIAAVLAHPALVFLGEISFSIYLVHWMVLETMLVHIVDHSLKLGTPMLYALYVASILSLSTAMHLFAEKPLRSLITKAMAPRVKPLNSLSPAEAKAFFKDDVSFKDDASINEDANLDLSSSVPRG